MALPRTPPDPRGHPKAPPKLSKDGPRTTKDPQGFQRDAQGPKWGLEGPPENPKVSKNVRTIIERAVYSPKSFQSTLRISKSFTISKHLQFLRAEHQWLVGW